MQLPDAVGVVLVIFVNSRLPPAVSANGFFSPQRLHRVLLP